GPSIPCGGRPRHELPPAPLVAPAPGRGLRRTRARPRGVRRGRPRALPLLLVRRCNAHSVIPNATEPRQTQGATGGERSRIHSGGASGGLGGATQRPPAQCRYFISRAISSKTSSIRSTSFWVCSAETVHCSS